MQQQKRKVAREKSPLTLILLQACAIDKQKSKAFYTLRTKIETQNTQNLILTIAFFQQHLRNRQDILFKISTCTRVKHVEIFTRQPGIHLNTNSNSYINTQYKANFLTGIYPMFYTNTSSNTATTEQATISSNKIHFRQIIRCSYHEKFQKNEIPRKVLYTSELKVVQMLQNCSETKLQV